MSPAPAIATRAFAVASSSVAAARFGSAGAEIAGRAASNKEAAPDTSARIFRVMPKLLFIFKCNARKIPRKKKRRLRSHVQVRAMGAPRYVKQCRVPELYL